jgi:hypothetical protein
VSEVVAVAVVVAAAVVVAVERPLVLAVAGCCAQSSCDAANPIFWLICDYKARTRMASCPRGLPKRGWRGGTSARIACHIAGRHKHGASRAQSQRASSNGPSA